MKVVMIAGNNELTDLVYSQIKNFVTVEKVIIEDNVSRTIFLKRRIKKLGLKKVVGQVLFSVFVVPMLKKRSQKRIREILLSNNVRLDNSYRKSSDCIFVKSVNDDKTIEELKKINPDVVIVQGTRIISSVVLSATDAIFINMHTGITPRYRGVHGAYWALVSKDYDNCGVTVHIVDKGIDTGGILYQKKIDVTDTDNFVTYPYLQIVEGLKLEEKVLKDIENNRLKIITNDLDSQLWTHPTLSDYIKNGVK